MLVQENLLHKMLSDKTQGSDEWQGMTSTQNPSNPLFLICPLKPVGRGRLGPISSGWAGPGRGHRREWPACPCQCVQRTQGQLGYYSNKRRVIADTEMQIPISCPLAF